MERNIEFDLQQQISNWVNRLKSESSVTESDTEELKSHLLDLMDELKEGGLDEEEAFIIASRRMGSLIDWEEDYKEVNNPIIQMRKSLIILGGVLAYFLLYYFVKFSSKLLFLILLKNKTEGYAALGWVSRYLTGAHLLFILFAASIYFMEKKTVSFIEKVRMKPKHTLLLLFIAIIFGITDTCLMPIIKNLLRQNRPLLSHLYVLLRDFDFSFPFVICVSFIVIYFRYYKKAKF